MRADSRNEDDWVVWVAEGAPGSEVVGGGARWGGDADAVGLHGRDVEVVAVLGFVRVVFRVGQGVFVGGGGGG